MVGAGAVARRRVATLTACRADVTVIAPDAQANEWPAGVTAVAREYRAGEAGTYFMVLACTNDRRVNELIHHDATAAGVLVNVADDPAHCTFVLPAVVRRGPVAVAVSTDGTSPALAVELRDRIAAFLEPLDVEAAIATLAAEREAIRATGASTESIDWTERVRRALDR